MIAASCRRLFCRCKADAARALVGLSLLALFSLAGARQGTSVADWRAGLRPVAKSIPSPAGGVLPPAGASATGDPLPRVQCPPDYEAATFAQGLSLPDGLAFSPAGVLFVAQESAGQVSRVEPYGSVAPVLGGLPQPEGLAFDDDGSLYVVEDVSGGRLIRVTADGAVTTLAAGLDGPEGVVWTPDGTLYLTESNVEYAASDFRTHVTALLPPGDATRLLTDTLPHSYAGIAVGPAGLYVTNELAGMATADSLFVIDPLSGTRTLFANGLVAPEGLQFAVDGGFPLYVAEEGTGANTGRLSQVAADGSVATLCTGFYSIEDVALDGEERLYVSEDGSGTIVRVRAGPPDRSHPRAIILFIGDGMGEPHRIAGRWAAVGQMGALAMDRAPFGGWAHTSSANQLVTDSAAAATAIATGVKTNNGVVGLDPQFNPLLTILERARAQGLAVGLVTNTQMTHATPAAFAAHVDSRDKMTEIALQMFENEVDVLLGGGEDEFLPNTVTGHYPELGERTDGRHLIDEAVAAGYTYVYDAAGLAAVDAASTTRLLGFFADEGMPRPFTPSLVEMTQKAIDVLSQDPDGFFLMVEGGQLDWAGHANDAENVITDTVGLDEAVAVAQAYAAAEGETLVIVTADHETGGMSVYLTFSGNPWEDGPFYMPGGTPFYVNWTTTGHTADDVPTTAQGPWSDLLAGVYENTHIHDVMRMALESAPALTLTQVPLPAAGATVRPTEAITYTLILTNYGTADADGLTLTDTLPWGVRYRPGSVRATPGFSVTVAPPKLVFTGTLPVDRALTATFGVTVSGVASGTLLVNRATVAATGLEPVARTVIHRVISMPRLAITKTAVPPGGSIVAPGDWLTYTVVAANDGDLVEGLILSDTLDLANLTLVVSRTTGGSLGGPNPVQVGDVDLGAGQSVKLTLGVRVTGGVSGTVIGNRASLVNTGTLAFQISSGVTHVVRYTGTLAPNLTLVKRAHPPGGTLLTQGDALTYTIVAHNGGGPASNVVLTDTIPAGTACIPGSVTANHGQAACDGARVRVSLVSFTGRSTLTLTFGVTVTTGATTTLTNVARLSSDQTPLQHSNAVSHPVRGTDPYRIYLPLALRGFNGPMGATLAPGRR